MSTVLLPCGVLVLLAVVWAELPALDRWVLGGPRSDRRRPAGRRGRRGSRSRRPGEPARRPLQLIAADLRRLSRQFALVPAGAPLVRWKALWSAYDAVLTEAAEALEVPCELGAPAIGTPRDIERLRVLAALECAGLVVHD